MESKTAIHILGRAVIVKDGHLLVNINQKSRFYFLPGGHIDPQESVADALVRELHEELAMKTTVTQFLSVFEYSFIPTNPAKCHSHEYNFLFKVDVPALQTGITPVSPEDHTEFAWVALGDLENVDFRPAALKDILVAWYQKGKMEPFLSKME